jgi:hypothetical protein
LPAISADVRMQVMALLGDIERGSRQTGWNGVIQAGARYQTNANIGSAEVGINEPLPFEKPIADFNAFALGTLGVVHPVTKNVTLEASASGYYADQAKVDRLDLGFVEFTAGPRLQSESGALWVKPYGLVQGILLGGSLYQQALGGGVTTRWTFGADSQLWLEPSFEYKRRVYYESLNYTTATDQTGDLFTYAIASGNRVSDHFVINERLTFGQNRAAGDYNSYDQYSGNISATVDFTHGAGTWTINPYASVSSFQYKGIAPPEVFAGFDTIRKDVLWTVGTNIETPFVHSSRLGMQLQYSKNDSNLDRYKYNNFLFMVGPLMRF